MNLKKRKRSKLIELRDKKGDITTNTNEIQRSLGNISIFPVYILIDWKI
jgi:hypothetical protein